MGGRLHYPGGWGAGGVGRGAQEEEESRAAGNARFGCGGVAIPVDVRQLAQLRTLVLAQQGRVRREHLVAVKARAVPKHAAAYPAAAASGARASSARASSVRAGVDTFGGSCTATVHIGGRSRRIADRCAGGMAETRRRAHAATSEGERGRANGERGRTRKGGRGEHGRRNRANARARLRKAARRVQQRRRARCCRSCALRQTARRRPPEGRTVPRLDG